jgi:hypothetical protein
VSLSPRLSLSLPVPLRLIIRLRMCTWVQMNTKEMSAPLSKPVDSNGGRKGFEEGRRGEDATDLEDMSIRDLNDEKIEVFYAGWLAMPSCPSVSISSAIGHVMLTTFRQAGYYRLGIWIRLHALEKQTCPRA